MKQLKPEELDILREAEEIASGQKSVFWKNVRQRMVNHVDEAAVLLEGCLSTDERIISALQRAWKQRKSMLDVVDGYIVGVLDAKKNLVEEIAKENGIEPEALDQIDPFIQ